MKRFWIKAGLILGVAQLVTMSLSAQETNTADLVRQLQRRIEELERKVETLEAHPQPSALTNAVSGEHLQALDQQVKTLQRQRELDIEAAESREKNAPKISLGESGFLFSSSDENFKLRIRGYIQADGRFYLDDTRKAFTDTFLVNRVRPVLEGTVFKNFDYKMMPDFGQGKAVIQDAYVDAHFLPWLNLRAGKFKGPVGLERLQSARDLEFVERGLPVDLVPNRDIGVALHGDFLKGVLGYEVGVFNGAADGSSDDADENDSKDIEGRIFAYPFLLSGVKPLQGLGLGVAGTTGHENGVAPSYKTIGQQTFFSFNPGVTATGTRSRIAPQAFYYWGPFGLLGEYVVSSEDVEKGTLEKQLDNSAWQVAGSYVLTGEKSSYSGVVPVRPFSPAQGRWGALEIVARVGQLHVDPAAFHNFGTILVPNRLADPTKSASQATAWSVGLNWYLNRDVKFMLDYEHTEFERGAAHGDRAEEHAILSRIQLAF